MSSQYKNQTVGDLSLQCLILGKANHARKFSKINKMNRQGKIYPIILFISSKIDNEIRRFD